jgi:hypothetical protein
LLTKRYGALETTRGRAFFAQADAAILRFSPTSRVVQIVVPVLIAIAIALRLAYYIANPPVSVDEVDLALNLMHRSYSGLLGRLDFNQAAPAGFLALQKLTVDSLGPTPYALRLIPLVAGIVSSVLIYPVAARIVGRRAAIIALALFAVSDPLMSFAATNKQYSIDVAVALGLYAVALSLPDRTTLRRGVVFALSGIVAVWLSHPAAFVLGGIGMTFVIASVRGRRWRETGMFVAVGAAWLVSFVVAYLLTRSSTEQIQHSIAATGNSVFGGNTKPGVLQTYGGIVRNLLGIPAFAHGVRTAIAVMMIAVALVGLAVLWRSRWAHAALLVLPLAFVFVATEARLYPDEPRTFLFLVPVLLILVAEGVGSLTLIKEPRIIALSGASALAILIGTATYAAVDRLRALPGKDSVEAIRYLTQKARTGDSLYVYRTAQYQFRYYVECGCFGDRTEVQKARRLWPIRPDRGHDQFAPALKSVPPRIISGRSAGDTIEDYRHDFEQLRGRSRVWILLIDSSPAAQHAIEVLLSRIGERDEHASRTRVLLYDLRHGRGAT